MSDSRPIVVAVGPTTEPALLTIGDVEPFELELSVGTTEYRAEGVDLFEALVALRRQLDADGRVLCVAGARLDVYPSGMSRQMGSGRQAYIHVRGRRPDRDDLVDIFEPAPPASVGTVEQQLASIGSLRGQN